MQYFDFARLIKRYSRTFQAAYECEGDFNEKGDFVKGVPIVETLQGAIINYKESRAYRSEGALSTQDKRLFVLKPLKKALLGATVIDKGNVYKIEATSENADFTGVYAYTLRYVSPFDEGDCLCSTQRD